MIDDILAWDDKLLEYTHDYIQWLFPLQELSTFNVMAPVLSNKQIEEFRESENLQTKLRKSFLALLAFYGFLGEEKNGQLAISRANTFRQKAQNWLSPHNHNFLRITRILKCLKLLGLPNDAVMFEKALEEVYDEYETIIGAETLRYWQQAVR